MSPITESETMSDTETGGDTVEETEAPVQETTATDVPEINMEDVQDIFGAQFAELEGLEVGDVSDLARTSGFRISTGDTAEFMADFGDRQIPAKMALNDAVLTALSWGKQKSQSRGNVYHLIQGQMRIQTDLYLMLSGDYVPLPHVLYSIFKQFAAGEKSADWDFAKFEQFCKNSGFPIEGNYIFNFELLGADEAAIEQYFPMFTDAGAREMERANKPQFIEKTYEFPQRGQGLRVSNLEISRGDPTRSQMYNKKFTEDGQEFVYEGNVFVDPISAQVRNFRRCMMHYKTSSALRSQANEANDTETKNALLQRAQTHRSMATMLLSNFGGVHRGASLEGDNLKIQDTYYTNRVRCGRFQVELPKEDKAVEFNFWQSNTGTTGEGATKAETGTPETGKPTTQPTVIDDTEEPF